MPLSKRPLQLLGISGSLRQCSYNTFALQAIAELAPPQVDVQLFQQVADLPLFNPDDEPYSLPALRRLNQMLTQADILLLASPEYAHGISGAMKNLLDHLVSGEAFVDMSVVLINTSPRASHAQSALHEVVKTMSGQVIEEAGLQLPLLGSGYDV
ncbi:MAG: NADPH-dependent FMN reductase, partial [Granulosicoccaceae bacterium]